MVSHAANARGVGNSAGLGEIGGAGAGFVDAAIAVVVEPVIAGLGRRRLHILRAGPQGLAVLGALLGSGGADSKEPRRASLLGRRDTHAGVVHSAVAVVVEPVPADLGRRLKVLRARRPALAVGRAHVSSGIADPHLACLAGLGQVCRAKAAIVYGAIAVVVEAVVAGLALLRGDFLDALAPGLAVRSAGLFPDCADSERAGVAVALRVGRANATVVDLAVAIVVLTVAANFGGRHGDLIAVAPGHPICGAGVRPVIADAQHPRVAGLGEAREAGASVVDCAVAVIVEAVVAGLGLGCLHVLSARRPGLSVDCALLMPRGANALEARAAGARRGWGAHAPVVHCAVAVVVLAVAANLRHRLHIRSAGTPAEAVGGASVRTVAAFPKEAGAAGHGQVRDARAPVVHCAVAVVVEAVVADLARGRQVVLDACTPGFAIAGAGLGSCRTDTVEAGAARARSVGRADTGIVDLAVAIVV